jgi:hypothetical protein
MSKNIPQSNNAARRRALLAQVHIARKELGIQEEDYRDMLRAEFGPATAADLSIGELEKLVERFHQKGWPRSSAPRSAFRAPRSADQASALKERIGQMILPTDFDETRLRGLVRKVCGVEDLRWCKDAVRLKRLIATINGMLDRGDIKLNRGTGETENRRE